MGANAAILKGSGEDDIIAANICHEHADRIARAQADVIRVDQGDSDGRYRVNGQDQLVRRRAVCPDGDRFLAIRPIWRWYGCFLRYPSAICNRNEAVPVAPIDLEAVSRI